MAPDNPYAPPTSKLDRRAEVVPQLKRRSPIIFFVVLLIVGIPITRRLLSWTAVGVFAAVVTIAAAAVWIRNRRVRARLQAIAADED